MKYLLDTHCWLWMQTEPHRFDALLMAALESSATSKFLSAASAWEIAIKYAVGRLPLPEPPADYVPERMRLNQVKPLPITPAHALAVATLPPHHRDPFDRILVAQARIEGLTLVTADRTLELYDAEVLRVRG
ncbi:MAG: type II toxin-antitoxin system VapC family toxin [Acidobacteria bacterium]|nr:type II toxin-antitoxin system VapC family toxin [Acidobacteriota bacterium]